MRPYITPRWIPGIVGLFNLLIVVDGCYVGGLAVSLAGRFLHFVGWFESLKRFFHLFFIFLYHMMIENKNYSTRYRNKFGINSKFQEGLFL